MSAPQNDILKQFCDVTGADEDRSRFFLESSGWQLEVALSSFYEHGGNVEENSGSTPAAPAPVVLSDSDMESPPGSPLAPQKKDKKPKKPSNQKFATLSSLQQESSSEEEEEGQAFYAGGSERSGQQILGPGKGRRDDIVANMFRSVRERGGVTLEDAPPPGRSGGAFSGAGYRLGQTNDDHELVTSAPTTNDGIRSVRLRLYREGFTVDGGELRTYSDPDNARFLNCIRQGEVPPELSSGGTGAEVRVSLEDRQLEPAPVSSHSRPAFAGKGHMLGSPTPTVVGVTGPSVGEQDRAANERAAQNAIDVNPDQPTTTIQFRLADGTRLTGRFNHTHTVSHLRQYVLTAAPQYRLQDFVLQTTFPRADLQDPEATVKDANLLNCVVVQRVC